MSTKQATAETGAKKIGDIQRLGRSRFCAVVFIHLSVSRTLFQKAGLNDANMPFWLGVELFFVISGFVVTKSFLAKNLSFRAFYLQRIFRLWPVLIFCYALAAAVNCIPTFATASWPVFLGQMPSVFFGYYLLHSVPPGQSVSTPAPCGVSVSRSSSTSLPRPYCLSCRDYCEAGLPRDGCARSVLS